MADEKYYIFYTVQLPLVLLTGAARLTGDINRTSLKCYSISTGDEPRKS